MEDWGGKRDSVELLEENMNENDLITPSQEIIARIKADLAKLEALIEENASFASSKAFDLDKSRYKGLYGADS